MKAVTLNTLADQDWKTQLARGYSNVPVGVVVDVINDEFTNFYGTWCEIMWNNTHYYVSKKDLSFNIEDIKIAEQNQQEIYMYAEKFRK